jgi:phenylalanyl-tRNA synthetase alpha chain
LPEVTQTEAKILKTLAATNGPLSVEQLSRKSGLASSAVSRALLDLSQKKLVTEHTEQVTEARLTEEGTRFSQKGLPERIVASVVIQNSGRISLPEALRQAELSTDYGPIVTGWIARKKWGRIEKTGSEVHIVIDKEPGKGLDERLVEQLKDGTLRLGQASAQVRDIAEQLEKRKIVQLHNRVLREVEITSLGMSTARDSKDSAIEQLSSLTSDMILSGDWERVSLRNYNVSSPVPVTWPGKYHPYIEFLNMVKMKLVALGFREVTGPIVEAAFVNNDTLYMPQDHPAREIHDLYYIKYPSHTGLKLFEKYLEKVRKTHENGWRTGSKGWGYQYSLNEASKLILRSHGTATSTRTLMSPDLQIPGKYFAIARCFRPDLIDRTHLTEFNQAEGIVVDPGLTLRNLLGILEMFAKEVAGADKVRFKPDYFPFTEPSIELQAFKEGYGWMEFGGSGIFRPEVTEPLGIHVPVLAWGLGVDRLYMMKQQIKDIRQLFTSDLDWIRKKPVS